MTFKQEVVEELKKAAEVLLGVNGAELTAETRFNEDLNCKSVHLVQFSAKLEDKYEVEVPYMEMKRCSTFADVAAFLDKALS
jgi:acyl carrier protein